MKSIIHAASVLCLAGLVLACGSNPASVAVNPISGKVFVTHSSDLQACDQAAQNCKQQKLSFKPSSAAVAPDGGLVFLAGSSVFRCDDAGQNCAETRLPISDAAGVSIAASGQIVIVSKKGRVVICDSAGCQQVARSE
jgi:DNA-binding beta-propeller fold protein YncE